MRKIIALNLKMNFDYEEMNHYLDVVTNKISDKNEIIFLPSSIYLSMFKKSGYKLGAQNVYYLDKGSFTGELSPSQIKTFGIDYALIGHSNRRLLFNEDDHLINSKIKGCLKNNLKVIFCIGETEEEKRLRKTALVIERQIINGLKGIDIEALTDVVIAYEPVWSIGSGKTLSGPDIEDSIKYIAKIINKEYGIEPKILYGGSVNKTNIKSILSINNVAGILVGTSALDPHYLVSMLDMVD